MSAARSGLAGLPAYRWLLVGTTINSLGNSISPVALAFAVLDLGGSATDLGLVVAAYALADLLAVMAGGVLGDRLPRTVLMRLSNAGAGLVQVSVAVALLMDWATIAYLGVAGALIGALGSLAGPSTQAILPQTVPTGLLRTGITVSRLSQNVARIVGAGAAGLLVEWIEPGGAVAVDAATFLVAAACFLLIRVPRVRDEDAAPSRFLTEAREGLSEVMRHSWLWSLIAMALIYHLFFGGAQGVLGPVVVGGRAGPAAWGYALAAMMAGFLAGGLLSLVWRPRRILLAGELGLLLTVCFPLAMALSDQAWVVVLGAALHGFGLEIFSVGWDLAIQENVPERMLARVYSFDQLGSFLARPLGLALTGPMAALVGDRTWLLVVVGAMLVAEVVPFALPDVRRLERRPAAAA
ncbi:MFS transporter [Nocardioides ultimimeridianus]